MISICLAGAFVGLLMAGIGGVASEGRPMPSCTHWVSWTGMAVLVGSLIGVALS